MEQEENNNIEYALRLKEIRQHLGLNQMEMAKRLGMRQSWLSKVESGKFPVRIQQLAAMKEAFGISIDDFLELEIPVDCLIRLGISRLPVRLKRNSVFLSKHSS